MLVVVRVSMSVAHLLSSSDDGSSSLSRVTVEGREGVLASSVRVRGGREERVGIRGSLDGRVLLNGLGRSMRVSSSSVRVSVI